MRRVHRKTGRPSRVKATWTRQPKNMIPQAQVALAEAAEWLGDWHPLAEQLGSADGLVTLASVCALLRLRPVHNVASLRQFLRDYQQHTGHVNLIFERHFSKSA